jgi:hypothetical protein
MSGHHVVVLPRSVAGQREGEKVLLSDQHCAKAQKSCFKKPTNGRSTMVVSVDTMPNEHPVAKEDLCLGRKS